jgi:hypothetical protein
VPQSSFNFCPLDLLIQCLSLHEHHKDHEEPLPNALEICVKHSYQKLFPFVEHLCLLYARHISSQPSLGPAQQRRHAI